MKSNKLIEDFHLHRKYQLAWTLPTLLLLLSGLFLSWPLESTFRQSL